eukprot:GHVU01153328.1.p1 GENE.GHVU01153328.1~~GHVU01153328.1.p1  ORF type:complete len:140 (-),score=5.95 GHVU01153328.1:142-561(-)
MLTRKEAHTWDGWEIFTGPIAVPNVNSPPRRAYIYVCPTGGATDSGDYQAHQRPVAVPDDFSLDGKRVRYAWQEPRSLIAPSDLSTDRRDVLAMNLYPGEQSGKQKLYIHWRLKEVALRELKVRLRANMSPSHFTSMPP